MPDATLDEILTYGLENDYTPADTAKALRQWQAEVSQDGREAVDPITWWRGVQDLDRDVHSAMQSLRLAEQTRVVREKIPDEESRAQFFQELETAQFDPDRIETKEWKELARQVTDIPTEPFEIPRRQYGSFAAGPNKIADYSLREKEDKSGYIALVEPAFEGSKPVVVELSSLDELRKDAESSFEREADFWAKRAASAEEEGYELPDDDPVVKSYQSALDYHRLFRTGKIDSALHEALFRKVRKSDEFLEQVPQGATEWLEQFTTRPVLQAVLSAAQAGATLLGEKDFLTDEYATQSVDVLTPGTLRSRIEAGESASIPDMISSGISSMATMFAPAGGVTAGAKLGAKAISKLPAAAQQALNGITSGTVLAGNNVAQMVGWGSMGAAEFGSNVAGAYQEADSLQQTDPERANRIRDLALFSSAIKSGMALMAEKIFPDEAAVLRGQRLPGREALLTPVKEAAEEGVTAMGTAVVDRVTGQEPDDVLEAAEAGFFGGLPFAGLVALSGRRNRIGDRVAESASRVADPDAANIINEARDIADRVTPEQEETPESVEEPPAEETGTEEVIEDEGIEEEAIEDEGIEEEEDDAIPDEIADLPEGEIRRRELEEVSLEDTLAEEDVTDEEDPETPAPQADQTDQVDQVDQVDQAEQVEQVEQAEEEMPPITPEEQDEADTLINFVNENEKLDLRRTEAPSDDVARFARQVEQVTGRRVVFVEGPSSVAGFARPGGKVVVINRNSRQAPRKLIGHELAHTLESIPEYQTFRDSILKRESFSDYKADLQKKGYSDEQIEDEFIADVVGENFTNRSFWRELAGENPNVFRRVADRVLDFIDKVLNRFRPNVRAKASPHVADLRAARQVLRDMLNQMDRTGSDGQTTLSPDQVTTETGDVQFSLEEQDEQYMRAVEGGDVETQQRIVDEVARSRGFEPARVMHGTSEKFTRFLKKFFGTTTQAADDEQAFFFTDSPVTARSYAVYASDSVVDREVKRLLKEADDVAATGDVDGYKKLFKEAIALQYGPDSESRQAELMKDRQIIYNVYLSGNFLEFDAEGKSYTGIGDKLEKEGIGRDLKDLLEKARKEGYDGVKILNFDDAIAENDVATHWAVFEPENIKSAEPIVYDDDGNIIPPSNRFDKSTDDIRYSREERRRRRIQRFGQETSLTHESVSVSDIQDAAGEFLPDGVSRQKARDAITLLRSLMAGDKSLEARITRAVQRKFADRLRSIERLGGDVANERAALRAFTTSAIIGRAVELSAKLYTKGGVTNVKTSRQLLEWATQASMMQTTRVSGDPTTAGRILRFSQLVEGGGVAEILHNVNESLFRWVDEKVGIPADTLKSLDKVPKRRKKAAVEEAALSATPGGKRVVELRNKAKGKIRKFIHWMSKQRPERSVEGESSQDDIEDPAKIVSDLEDDWSNSDEIIERLNAVIENAPDDVSREEAQKRLDEIQAAMDEAAEAEKKVTGENKRLNRIAKNFLEYHSGERKAKQASSDWRNFRTLLREVARLNKSPQEAVEIFLALGGDPELEIPLLKAFAEITNDRVARQENQKLLKRVKKEAAEEEDRRIEVRRKAKKDAQKLIDAIFKEIGFGQKVEETVRKEAERREREDRERLENAVKKASDTFGKFGPQRQVIRPESFEDQLEMVLNANPNLSLDNEADRLEIVKELLRQKGFSEEVVERAAPNAISGFEGRLNSAEAKRVEQEVRKASNAFGIPNTPRKKHLSFKKQLEKVLTENPDLSLDKETDRLEIVKELLRQRGFSEDAVERAAPNALKNFESRLASKEARRIAQEARRKKKKEEGEKTREFRKAVRLLPGEGPKNEKKGPRKTFVREIEDIIESHPEWDISDLEDRKKILETALKGRGISEATAKVVTEKFMQAFNNALTRITDDHVKRLLKGFRTGKLTGEMIQKAIRLNILDPSKSMASSIGAALGFNGLTPNELRKITDISEKARKVQNDQVRMGLLMEQMRIIYAARGVPAPYKKVISSSVRASMYASLSTQTTNLLAPTNLVIRAVIELASDIADDPVRILKSIRNHIRALRTAWLDAWRSFKIAMTTDATRSFSVGAESMKRMDKLEKIVHIDALSRQLDQNIKKLSDKSIPWTKKVHTLIGTAYAAQKYVWTMLGALDSFYIESISSYLTRVNAIRLSSDRKEDMFDEFMAVHGHVMAAARHAAHKLGLTGAQAEAEAQTRVYGAYYNYLRDKFSFPSKEVIDTANREAVHISGNHAEIQGAFSSVGNLIIRAVEQVPLGLGALIGGPVRIIANLADSAAWYFAPIGIPRVIEEARRRRNFARDPKNPKYAPKFHLSALTDAQFDMRKRDVLAGTIFQLVITALLNAQPDDPDERYFEITTSYPTDQPTKDLWREKGFQEYSIYIGKAGRGRIQFKYTKGIGEFLAFPLITAANYDRVRRGELSYLNATALTLANITETAFPFLYSFSEDLINLGRTDRSADQNTIDNFAYRISTIVNPFAGLQRSVQKFSEAGLNKRAMGWQWSRIFPVLSLFRDRGQDVELLNSLGEPVQNQKGFLYFLSLLGFPFAEPRSQNIPDTKIQKDFEAMDYVLPAPMIYNKFVKDYVEPNPDIVEKNGESSPEFLYNKFVRTRAKHFKDYYYRDPRPGRTANDQRRIFQIIEQGDQAAFKARMSDLWKRATNDTKKELGIVE